MSSIGLPMGQGCRMAVCCSEKEQVNTLQLAGAVQANKINVGVSHIFDAN